MPIADLLIVSTILISVVVGFFRGLVKEAISVGALVIAVWAALHLGPVGSKLVGEFGSAGIRMWIGRALVFFVVLALGALVGWGVRRLVKASGLSGTDRVLGMGFGFCRGALLLGVFSIAADLLGFSEDNWWTQSRLAPYAERIGSQIRALAPRALDYIDPDDGATDNAGSIDAASGGLSAAVEYVEETDACVELLES